MKRAGEFAFKRGDTAVTKGVKVGGELYFGGIAVTVDHGFGRRGRRYYSVYTVNPVSGDREYRSVKADGLVPQAPTE